MSRFWQIWFIGFLLLIDQFSKYIITRMLADNIFKSIPVCYGLDLVYTINKGISFGLFSKLSYSNLFFTVIISIILIFLFNQLRKQKDLLIIVGFVFILSGGTSNLIDRFFYSGVIDFLYFYWGERSFFTCNIADIFINFGAVFLVIANFFRKKTN